MVVNFGWTQINRFSVLSYVNVDEYIRLFQEQTPPPCESFPGVPILEEVEDPCSSSQGEVGLDHMFPSFQLQTTNVDVQSLDNFLVGNFRFYCIAHE